MVDTGTTVNLFKKTVWCQLEGKQNTLAQWGGHKLVGVEGSPLSVCGVSTLHLAIAGTTFVSDFVIVDVLGVDCIIGSDFVMTYRGVVDLSKNTLQFRNVMVPLEKMPGKTLDVTNGCGRELQVALVETYLLPSSK